MAVFAEMQLPADFEHVRDPLAIIDFGMVAVPGLVVDGRVVASGRVPTKDQMRAWLEAAVQRNNIQPRESVCRRSAAPCYGKETSPVVAFTVDSSYRSNNE
jgi:hypothetical protein